MYKRQVLGVFGGAFAAVYTALELSSVTLRYDGFTGTEGAGNLVGGVESYVVEGV